MAARDVMEGILNKNILIVDDDERMLRALAKTLSCAGAVVATTQQARDAVEILCARQQHVDLVITDLRMPLMSGAALVHSIHQIFPDLPIIVLTAFGSPESRAECLRQGAVAFLEKNLGSTQLIAEIKRVFTQRKLVKDQSGMDTGCREWAVDEKFKTKVDDE
jgi:DNA-binding NtrC family response regulator